MKEVVERMIYMVRATGGWWDGNHRWLQTKTANRPSRRHWGPINHTISMLPTLESLGEWYTHTRGSKRSKRVRQMNPIANLRLRRKLQKLLDIACALNWKAQIQSLDDISRARVQHENILTALTLSKGDPVAIHTGSHQMIWVCRAQLSGPQISVVGASVTYVGVVVGACTGPRLARRTARLEHRPSSRESWSLCPNDTQRSSRQRIAHLSDRYRIYNRRP